MIRLGFWILISLAFMPTAYAQQRASHERVDEEIKNNCRVDFNQMTGPDFDAAEVTSFETEARQYLRFQVSKRIRRENLDFKLKISLGCPFGAQRRQLTRPQIELRDLIAQEDSGGRYYRHVAWQRNISGLNWKGKIAYVDHLFGDGTRSPSSMYLICLSVKEALCVEVVVDSTQNLTEKDQIFMEKSIRKIKYIE